MNLGKKYEVIYEDAKLLVCYKYPNIPVQTKRVGVMDLESMLRNERVKNGEASYIGIINRLDQPVEGLVLVGKDQKTVAFLTEQQQKHAIQKEYYAIVEGSLEKEEDSFIDYLEKDGRNNCSRVVDAANKKGKKAELSYRLLKAGAEGSLIRVSLKTGRHHQIRVQMASHGHPLVGDQKYGRDAKKGLCLCSCYLRFLHPDNKKEMEFEIQPKGERFQEFFRERNEDES